MSGSQVAVVTTGLSMAPCAGFLARRRGQLPMVREERRRVRHVDTVAGVAPSGLVTGCALLTRLAGESVTVDHGPVTGVWQRRAVTFNTEVGCVTRTAGLQLAEPVGRLPLRTVGHAP
ncbi:MAG: hypothetical protein CVT67_01615 [Actinobacteria bacterium HGW-Actinobacteria-7]|nr:MAG: hypothetical protein CVT67_01615 [Actinobacteria bacterium HGW-Actinobacteria-7]